MPWVIRDWSAIYESSESRKVKNLEWVRVPVKHDGSGFRHLMKTPEGHVAFACFMLMVQVGAKMPVRGILRRVDQDCDPAYLELKTGMPGSNFVMAFDILQAAPVEWIYWADPDDIPDAPDAAGDHPGTSGRNGKSGKSRQSPVTSGDARRSPRNVRTKQDILSFYGNDQILNDPPERPDDPPERPDNSARSRATRREESRERIEKSGRAGDSKIQWLEDETGRLLTARPPLTEAEKAEAERTAIHDLAPIGNAQSGNLELIRLRHVMQQFASHVTRQVWRQPDMEITRRAKIAARDATVDDIALFLRALGRRKQAGGNLPLNIGSYGFVVQLIETEFAAMAAEQAEANCG